MPLFHLTLSNGYVGSGQNGLADRLFKLNVRFVPLLNALLAFIVFVTTRPLMSFLSIMLTISPRKE